MQVGEFQWPGQKAGLSAEVVGLWYNRLCTQNNSVQFNAFLSKSTIAQLQFRLNQTNFFKFCATIAIEYNSVQWNVLKHNALGSKVHFGAQYIALHMLHNALSAFGTGCIEVHWLHWKVHFWLVHWIAIVQCSAWGNAFLARWPDCNGQSTMRNVYHTFAIGSKMKCISGPLAGLQWTRMTANALVLQFNLSTCHRRRHHH